jgi:hypothetical protein
MSSWLLLHYTLPPHPSALRVYIWRKLKRLGAILLNETVWVLPDSSRTAEQFQWLTAEIQERNGEAYLWRSNLVQGLSDETLINRFNEQVDHEYKKLQKELKKKNPDLTKLSRHYQQIAAADYFQSKLSQQVRRQLLAVQGETK